MLFNREGERKRERETITSYCGKDCRQIVVSIFVFVGSWKKRIIRIFQIKMKHECTKIIFRIRKHPLVILVNLIVLFHLCSIISNWYRLIKFYFFCFVFFFFFFFCLCKCAKLQKFHTLMSSRWCFFGIMIEMSIYTRFRDRCLCTGWYNLIKISNKTTSKQIKLETNKQTKQKKTKEHYPNWSIGVV